MEVGARFFDHEIARVSGSHTRIDARKLEEKRADNQKEEKENRDTGEEDSKIWRLVCKVLIPKL